MKKKKFLIVLAVVLAALCMFVVSACNVQEGKEVTGVQLSQSQLSVAVGESKSLTCTVLPEDASNKHVRWDSDDESVATVEDGVVTGVAEGNAVITVTTLNGNRKATCSVEVTAAASDTVPVSGITVTPATLSLEVGGKGNLTAEVLPDNATYKTVAWTSENGDVATVDQSGQVTAIAAGTARIKATAGGKTAYCDVEVKAATPGNVPVDSITVTPATLSLEVGGKGNLTAEVLPVNATDKTVVWTSENGDVATVDQNGQVTAVAAGTARIKATAGGKMAYCDVTVSQSEGQDKKYDVNFYSEGNLVESQKVEEGQLAKQPAGVKREGYTLKGWAVGSESGDIFDFNTPIEENTDFYAVWESDQEPDEKSPITYRYAGNECAAFEWTEADISSSNVKVGYKLSSESSYTYLTGSDKALIREAAVKGAARVDIVGLKGGENYDFSITTSEGKTYTVTGMKINKYDRSGYAHFNYNSGVGAYNDDGTLKSKAVVIYVTEATKNNLTVTIGGKKYQDMSIAEILGKASEYTSTPVVVRIIGTVGAATWTHIEEGGGARQAIKPEDVTGVLQGTNVLSKFNIDKSGDVNITQEQLINNKVNTLDTSTYAELKGLDSKMKYSKSKDEFDSAWNNCIVKNAKDITVEGIGEDARIFQWGFTWKNCSSIEVRNITFEDYTEDACSFEGDETGVSSLGAFKSGNYWVHHNTFEEGVNYWDVCNEQDKHDGDGSTDFKGVKNVTLSYNVYNGTHKTGLIGGSNSQTTANVTFHHNFYNGCKARLPLGRQANMHMYNNYYKDTTDTDISLRAEAYAFIENCYFENNNNSEKMVELRSDGPGSAKIIGCVIDVNKIYLENDKPLGTDGSSDRLYLGSDRNAKVKTNENKFGKDFDTSAELFYYANGKSDVTEMLTAEQTKVQIPLVAGVMKRTSGTGGGTVGGGETDPGTGGGTGGETDPGTQGGGGGTGDTQTVANCVVIFSNGAQLLSNGSLTELPANSGITVTNVGGEYKNKKFTYGGKDYSGGIKLNSTGEAVIKLGQTKRVTLYFYDFNATPAQSQKIVINDEEYNGENRASDGDGIRYSVTLSFVANTEYSIKKVSGSAELELCYMVIEDAE